MTLMISSQSIMTSNCCLCSNDESSPSQALDDSGAESLKSEKYYLTSALPDGVLQQVEVTASDQLFWHVKVRLHRVPLLSDCVLLFSVS